MYQNINSCFFIIIQSFFIVFSLSCNKVERKKYEAFNKANDICNYYLIDGNKFFLLKDKNKICYSEDSLLNDYHIVSPFLPASEKKVLVQNISGKIKTYEIIEGHLSEIPFKQALNFQEIYKTCYFSDNILLLDENNTLSVYIEDNNRWIKDYEIEIPEPDVFNIYGGVTSDTVLIEAGYFPSGGCEYIKYYRFDLINYGFKECSEKVLPINSSKSPFDVFYMDIDQKYFFFPYKQKVDFSWKYSDDYILNSKFDTVGRALRKAVYYNGYGFSINKHDNIDYYIWQNEMDKLICFPVNFNFEKQIYRVYYDSLLIEKDLLRFNEFEIGLLKNVIIRKNNGIIRDERIKNVLSVYAFYFDYKGSEPIDKVKIELQGNQKRNYMLLERIK